MKQQQLCFEHSDRRGACDTCAHIRSYHVGAFGAHVLIPYKNFGKAKCAINPSITDIIILEKPHLELPVNTCWEPQAEGRQG